MWIIMENLKKLSVVLLLIRKLKEPFQTAIGNTGIRIRMMEYSWSDTPEPYDF